MATLARQLSRQKKRTYAATIASHQKRQETAESDQSEKELENYLIPPSTFAYTQENIRGLLEHCASQTNRNIYYGFLQIISPRNEPLDEKEFRKLSSLIGPIRKRTYSRAIREKQGGHFGAPPRKSLRTDVGAPAVIADVGRFYEEHSYESPQSRDIFHEIGKNKDLRVRIRIQNQKTSFLWRKFCEQEKQQHGEVRLGMTKFYELRLFYFRDPSFSSSICPTCHGFDLALVTLNLLLRESQHPSCTRDDLVRLLTPHRGHNVSLVDSLNSISDDQLFDLCSTSAGDHTSISCALMALLVFPIQSAIFQ